MRLIRLLKHDLARETAHWVDDGIINREQAEQICARYGADFNPAQQHSWGYRALVTLGYLFIGLALITLIGNNWDELPRALRMTGLISLTLLTNLYAWLQFQRDQISSAQGFFFLGSLFYGASIILIAQIYHLGEHMPDGIFYWALGSLFPALLLNSRWLMVNALGLATLWFFVETGMGFYPALFPLFIAAAIWPLRSTQTNLVLFLMVVLATGSWLTFTFAWWWGEHRFDFDVENLALIGGQALLAYGVGCYLASQSHHAARDYGAVLHVWCLRFAILTLLLFSFKEPWRELIRENWRQLPLLWLLMLGMTSLGAVLVWRAKRNLTGYTALSATALAALWLCTGTRAVEYAVHLQVLTNIVLIIMGVYLLISGIQRGITHYFFLGILVILLTGLLRYIDLIGDYIGGALLFIFFAAILLGAARYWKHRSGGMTS